MLTLKPQQRHGYISFVGSGRTKYDALLDAVTKLQRAGYSIFGQPLPWLDADETVWSLSGSEGELYHVEIEAKRNVGVLETS